MSIGGGLLLSSASVGPGDNDAYLLVHAASGASLLVDAAAAAPRLLDLVRTDAGGRLDAVLTTHAHRDHWQALAEVVRSTGATTAAGRHDAGKIGVRSDRLLDHDDVVTVGAVALRVVHLVGHTPGSVALVHEPPDGPVHVFTGDSLFPGGVGRTRSPEAFTSLLGDVERHLFDLPDTTVVHPGHGAPTTIGAERPSLAGWRARRW